MSVRFSNCSECNHSIGLHYPRCRAVFVLRDHYDPRGQLCNCGEPYPINQIEDHFYKSAIEFYDDRPIILGDDIT